MSTTRAVRPAGVPVLSVDEQIVLVPPAGHIVSNRARKLLFFFEAHCSHRVAGMEGSGLEGSAIELSAGDVLVLPFGCRQLYRPLTPETTRIHALRLLLDPEIIAPLAIAARPEVSVSVQANAEGEGDSVANWARSHFASLSHLRGGMTPEVRETLARLRRESEVGAGMVGGMRAAGSRFRVGAACLDLLVLVARQLEQQLERSPLSQAAGRGGGAFRVEQVREFVIKHLDTPLSLPLIAAHLGISPEHLSRVWKGATGTTLFDFVRRARIERAKTLLTASDLNISQIALACGFSSLALFSRTFKGETGVAPGHYRERLAG